ncbi:MAG: ABC transporter ATP-binding protein [Candidatus Omnitrophota bacterium]
MNNIISVKNLKVEFETSGGTLKAVRGVDFKISPKTTLGLVGESGCGKTVTCLAVLKLIEPPGNITGGEIIFEGRDLLKMDEEKLRRVRGAEISFVFQEPMTSLNPVLTVGEQIIETILTHRKMKKKEAVDLAVSLLEKVKMPFARKIIYQYPHQLSGGMCQRVMIAQALSCNPKLLIADEPTTALDVTVQARILKLLRDLKEEFDMSVLIVTHDFGIVAGMADFVAVMYAGQIVEYAPTEKIFRKAKHPYTAGLLNALPQVAKKRRYVRLKEIAGSLPDLTKPIKGCVFYPRCYARENSCLEAESVLRQVEDGHWVRCFKTVNGG